MANKLSESNKSRFYDFIVRYEKDLCQKFGRCNIKDQTIISFCDNNRILLGRDCTNNAKNIPQFKYFILWHDRKPEKYKGKANDSAHNLLRHLRNAMAHGNISSETRQKFVLADYNDNGRQTMRGKISCSLMFKLISCIIQTIK